jgi:hypothetical protein
VKFLNVISFDGEFPYTANWYGTGKDWGVYVCRQSEMSRPCSLFDDVHVCFSYVQLCSVVSRLQILIGLESRGDFT